MLMQDALSFGEHISVEQNYTTNINNNIDWPINLANVVILEFYEYNTFLDHMGISLEEAYCGTIRRIILGSPKSKQQQ